MPIFIINPHITNASTPTGVNAVWFRFINGVNPCGLCSSLGFQEIHMIETKIVSENPTVVCHTLSGRLNEDDAESGAAEAMSIITDLVRKGSKFNLILDMRGYVFDDLNAHRIWSTEFKQQISREHVARVAIVGKDTPQLKAEREMMESGTLKFFIELEQASQWVKSVE